MEEYVKVKDELEDKLSAQQQSVQVMLQNQNRIHTNVKQLIEDMEKFSGILEGLVDTKAMQNSMIVQKNQNQVKASEVVNMQLQQIIANMNFLMRNKNFRAALNNDVSLPSQKKEASKSISKTDIEEIKPAEPVEKINPNYMKIDKIEVLLIEQRLKEAIEEFQAFKKSSREGMDLTTFMKLKKVENIIIEEIIGTASLTPITERLDLNKLSAYVDTLNDFGKHEDAIQIPLNHASTFIKSSSKNSKENTKIVEFLNTAEELQIYLNDKFQAIYSKNEHVVYFAAWFIKELSMLLNDVTSGVSDTEALINILERLKIEVTDYDLKGLSCDFLIDKIIYDLQAQLKLHDNN